MLSRPQHEYTIITPFGRQPDVEPHRSKYLILHDEHQRVCEYAGWDFINGPYLDDAARADVDPYWTPHQMGHFLEDATAGFDQVWVPWGIHHPDHLIVNGWTKHIATHQYEELPYFVDYPEPRAGHDFVAYARRRDVRHRKWTLCAMYQSQVDRDMMRRLDQPERLWRSV